MSIHDFTVEELTSNILQIVKKDASYKERVTLASNIFRSAKQTAGERAAYWIEHVTKFGGGHLKSAGNDLSLLEYMLVDVAAFLIGCIISVAVFLVHRFPLDLETFEELT